MSLRDVINDSFEVELDLGDFYAIETAITLLRLVREGRLDVVREHYVEDDTGFMDSEMRQASVASAKLNAASKVSRDRAYAEIRTLMERRNPGI